jgi:hypothetical protein
MTARLLSDRQCNLRFEVSGLTISDLSVPISHRIIDVRQAVAVRDCIASLFVLRQFGQILPDFCSLDSSWVNLKRPFEILFVRPPAAELSIFKLFDSKTGQILCVSVYFDETIKDVKQILHEKFDFSLEGLLISDNAVLFLGENLAIWNIDLSKRYVLTYSQASNPRDISVPEMMIWKKEFRVLALTELHFVKQPNPVRDSPSKFPTDVIRIRCSPRILRAMAEEAKLKSAAQRNLPKVRFVAGKLDSRPRPRIKK